MKIDNANTWLMHASMWELLAFSLRYPHAELVEALMSGEWSEATAEIAEALEVELPTSWNAGLARYGDKGEYAGAEDVLATLRAEATRLFVGAPEPACSPYEGIWRAEAENIPGFLFVNSHSMDIERLFKACGLGRPEGTNEPLDHIATECEFLQWLCLVNAGVVQPQEGVEAPEGTWVETYEAFLVEHIHTWVPAFTDAVIEKAREPFFCTVALILKQFVA